MRHIPLLLPPLLSPIIFFLSLRTKWSPLVLQKYVYAMTAKHIWVCCAHLRGVLSCKTTHNEPSNLALKLKATVYIGGAIEVSLTSMGPGFNLEHPKCFNTYKCARKRKFAKKPQIVSTFQEIFPHKNELNTITFFKVLILS